MQINGQVQLSCGVATGVVNGANSDGKVNCQIVQNGVGDYTLFVAEGFGVGSQKIQIAINILQTSNGKPAIYQFNPTPLQTQILFFDATALPALVPVDVLFEVSAYFFP